MDDLAGRRADSSPLLALSDDLLGEILLCLPPEPIHLFRASFVSKHWRRLVHDGHFLRRFREFHGGTPPVLGFFNNLRARGCPFFVPTAGAFGLSTAAKMPTDDWWALDCRHGRALLLPAHRSATLLVWDIVTGDERYLPFPPAYDKGRHWTYNAAVLCAPGHGDCHASPFLVAFICTDHRNFITSVCVYPSETGVWGETTSIAVPDSSVLSVSTPLIGNTLYWMLDNNTILEFDLDTHSLDLTGEIPHDVYNRQIIIMPADDGRLGFAGVDGSNLHLWSSMASVDGRMTWAHCRVIDLKSCCLAPEAMVACMHTPEIVGYSEEANVIFISVHTSIYMIHLNSMQIKEVLEKSNHWFGFPYTSFYTPGNITGGGNGQAEPLNGI